MTEINPYCASGKMSQWKWQNWRAGHKGWSQWRSFCHINIWDTNFADWYNEGSLIQAFLRSKARSAWRK